MLVLFIAITLRCFICLVLFRCVCPLFLRMLIVVCVYICLFDCTLLTVLDLGCIVLVFVWGVLLFVHFVVCVMVVLWWTACVL